jgi:beta-N-acetylhexosaminidase
MNAEWHKRRSMWGSGWRARPVRTVVGMLCVIGSVVASTTTATGASPKANRPSVATRCTVANRLRGWSNDRLAAQTIVVPVDAGSLPSVGSLVASGVGGVLLFGDDAGPGLPSAIAALDRRALGGVDPAVMVDEEGGTVERLANLVGALPSAREMAATLSDAAIEALGRRVGARLRSFGVTVDLAPVLDLDAGSGPNARDADGTRSFSASAPVATRAGAAFAAGLALAGVLPVFKHFPGLGGASANTDLGPASTVPYATLERAGLLPFASVIAHGASAIMVSNASVPGLSVAPSSVSPAVITTLLRHKLGFGGLVLTDSLSAPSVTPPGGSLQHSVIEAIRAGADMELFNASAASVSSTTEGLISAVVGAVHAGAVTRAELVTAVGHVLVAKGELPECS